MEGGVCAEALRIHCPISQELESLDHCLRCPRYEGLLFDPQGELIQCHVPNASLGASSHVGRDLLQAMERTSLCELRLPDLECLDPELDAAQAGARMAAQHQSCAAVVDDRGVLLGVVSAATLALAPSAVEVEDAMAVASRTLLPTDSLLDAARQLTRTELDRLPVVTAEGELVGMVSAKDLVAWLVATLGAR